MKRDNINYVLVGVIVLVALGLLLSTLAAITGRGGVSTSYYVEFSNVAGLRFGAPVYYEGYKVGQILAIEPQREDGRTRYRVELGVQSDWSIPVDSVAQRQASGLLADMAIGIREGASREVLPAGGELVGEEGGDVFSAMNELAGELTVLSKERIRPLIETLAMRVDSLGATLDEGAPALVLESQRLLERLNKAADSINAVLDQPNREAIAGTLSDVRALAAELKTTQARADTLLLSLNEAVDENRPALRQSVQDIERTISAIAQRIDAITHHLESSSRNFDEFSREIRRSPNRLLFTAPQDQVED
jgi:phospholipid/cholesterol/gamma-HCH transport system substrate-binding protein